jgi:ADP-glucose pyrophosphorylase
MFANSTYDVNYTGKLVWATDSFTEPGDYYIALCTTNSAYYQPVTELYPVYVSFESLTEVANIATEDQDATPSYYTLTGIYVGSDKSLLSNGIYIEKRNGKAKKLKIGN